VVVVIRKISVVAIGTFGTLGVVDLQAFMALGVVFLSICLHLIGEPFDKTRRNTRLLHNLESVALSICWITFWAGLLFYLGHTKAGSVSRNAKVVATVTIVLLNSTFLVVALYLFLREYLRDRRHATIRRETTMVGRKKLIMGARSALKLKAQDEAAGVKHGEHATIVKVKPLALVQRHSKDSHDSHAESVIDNFHGHEEMLGKLHRTRSTKAKRKTQDRIQVRAKLKSSRILSKVPGFSHLDDALISSLVDTMKLVKFAPNQVVCKEGEFSNSFYVILFGRCHVTSIRHGDRIMATIGEHAFFGESMMSETPQRYRTATVTVVPEKEEDAQLKKLNRHGCHVLELKLRQYKAFCLANDFDFDHVSIQAIAMQRKKENRSNLVAGRAVSSILSKLHSLKQGMVGKSNGDKLQQIHPVARNGETKGNEQDGEEEEEEEEEEDASDRKVGLKMAASFVAANPDFIPK
jgi:hypothetical protein